MKIERSSGNVFRDLGFSSRQAESLRLRAELMIELKRLIQARKLTQRSAARLLGVTQPRVSDLVRGRIDLFSIEALVNMLAKAGRRVELRFRAPPPNESASRLEQNNDSAVMPARGRRGRPLGRRSQPTIALPSAPRGSDRLTHQERHHS